MLVFKRHVKKINLKMLKTDVFIHVLIFLQLAGFQPELTAATISAAFPRGQRMMGTAPKQQQQRPAEANR